MSIMNTYHEPLPMCEPSLPLLDQLKRRRTVAQKVLQDIDNAIKVLEDNPQIQQVLDVLAKVTNCT